MILTILRYIAFLMMVTVLSACGTTDEVTDDENDEPEVEDPVAEEPEERDLEEIFTDPEKEEPEEIEKDLPEPKVDIDFRSYRSSLRDQYATVQNTIPEAYLEEEEEEERRISNSGFRVQIASSRDISEAEDYEDKFKKWAEEMEFEIKPEVYVIFRQPNYRVHVGDFLERSDALRFSNIVRQEFDDAWVVRDRIDPQVILRTLEEEEDVKLDELADQDDEEKADDDEDEKDEDNGDDEQRNDN